MEGVDGEDKDCFHRYCLKNLSPLYFQLTHLDRQECWQSLAIFSMDLTPNLLPFFFTIDLRWIHSRTILHTHTHTHAPHLVTSAYLDQQGLSIFPSGCGLFPSLFT